MMQTQEAEPPSRPRPQHVLVGQDRRGNWVVQDAKGVRGGLFVNRDAALRFARAENGYRPPAVVMVSGLLELDLRGPRDAPAMHTETADPWLARQVA
jgi:hypothetical protein